MALTEHDDEPTQHVPGQHAQRPVRLDQAWYDADAVRFGAPVTHDDPVAPGVHGGHGAATPVPHAAAAWLGDPRATLAVLPDASLVVAADGRITFANGHAQRLFGCGVVGGSVEDLVPIARRAAHAGARAAFQKTGHVRAMSARDGLLARRADGTEFPVDVSLSPIHTPDGPAVLAIVVDTSARMAAVDRLSRQALTDTLTGLGNRAALVAAIADRFAQPITDVPLVVLAIDLDGLRDVNHRLGHAGGDDLLRAYAARMRATVRAGDIVVRNGGDEFIVLCSGSIEAARLIASRLTGPISVRRTDPSAGYVVTASIGLAARRGHEASHTLLRRADVALMAAKAAGRHQVVEAH